MQIEFKEAYDDLESIRLLFEEYTRSLGIDLAFQNYAQELANLPGKYAAPDGRLYIAYANGVPAGCIGLRRFDMQRCEMKRLYVRDRFRGLKIGELLAEKVIGEAKAIGYRAMLLDTLSSMQSARGLYKKLGFTEIAPYYNSPVAGTCFLCLTL